MDLWACGFEAVGLYSLGFAMGLQVLVVVVMF